MSLNEKRFAVMFAGQGSQAVGMMQEFAEDATVERTFEEASDALGFDVWALLSDESRLHDTQYTQPAIVTSSIALWRLLEKQLPVAPSYMAGHSLGEYSALCAAGVLCLDDTVRLVHQRGKLMSEAVAGIETQMAAVLGLEDEQVVDLCRHASEVAGAVNPANFNSPAQVVIAGTSAGVAQVMQDVETLGKKCVPLKVSVPSHCSLMLPASEALGKLLQETEFHPPKIPVIQNLTAAVSQTTSELKEALIRQLSEPVQWAKTMQRFADKHIEFVIECSYGNVLTNLAKRQSTPLPAFGVDKPTKIEKILEQFDES